MKRQPTLALVAVAANCASIGLCLYCLVEKSFSPGVVGIYAWLVYFASALAILFLMRSK